MNTCAKYNISNTTHGHINMAGTKNLEDDSNETIYLEGLDFKLPQFFTAAFFVLVGEVGLKLKSDPDHVAMYEVLLICK